MTEASWKKLVKNEEDRMKKRKKEVDATEKPPEEGAQNAWGKLFAACKMHHSAEHCFMFSIKIISKQGQFSQVFFPLFGAKC